MLYLLDGEAKVTLIDCGYDEIHEYSDDWIFGGANGLDPRADPRWQPVTYRYYDAHLCQVHITQTPLCDEQAIDEFSLVSSYGNLEPVYLSVKRPGEKETFLQVQYYEPTDTVHPWLESGNV